MKQRADINITQLNVLTSVVTAANAQTWPDTSRWLTLPNPYLIWMAVAVDGTPNHHLYWKVQTPDGVIIPDNVAWMMSLANMYTPFYEIDKKLFGPPYMVRVYTYGDEAENVGFSFFTSEQAGYADLVEVNNNLEKLHELLRVQKGLFPQLTPKEGK